jgi:hypothetical protein
MQTRTRKRPKPRSPYAVELRRLGHKVKPSKKAYTRKGRSKDRPFDVSGRPIRPFAMAGSHGPAVDRPLSTSLPPLLWFFQQECGKPRTPRGGAAIR